MSSRPITFALSKGRLAQNALDLLKFCGVTIAAGEFESRKLEVFDTSGDYRFLFVKPADVPIYVERGVADLGVVGKDTLLEEERDICEMLDLGFGKCRLCVAGFEDNRDRGDRGQSPQGYKQPQGALRVATKYPNITRKYYAAKGITPDIVRLSGSVELAPIVGLSDVIVDLVESGKTLEANGLSVLEEICTISARLAVNKVSLKAEKDKILSLIEKMYENSKRR